MSANVEFARQQIKKYGRFIVVCREPIGTPRNRLCVNIGTLSRLAPDYALRIADYLEGIGTSIGGKSSVRLTEREFWKQMLGNGHFAGCADRPEAARLVLTARAPVSNRPMAQTTCARSTDVSNPLAGAIGTLDRNTSPIGDYLSVYLSVRNQCQGQTVEHRQKQGGQQGMMDAGGAEQGIGPGKAKEPSAVAKAWREIVDAMGGGDGPDTGGPAGGGGTRGYCFEDSACAQSCETAARAKAIANELRTRFQFSGCNADVTPHPDGTRTCYNVITAPVVTAAQLATVRKEFCEKAAGLKQPGGDEGASSCPVVTSGKHIAVSDNICRNPRAMCSPEQVDPVDFPLRPGAAAPDGVLPPSPSPRR